MLHIQLHNIHKALAVCLCYFINTCLFSHFLQDLLLPLKVEASDIVSVLGKKAEFGDRPVVQYQNIASRPKTAVMGTQEEVTFLSTWRDKYKSDTVKVRKVSKY